MLQVIDSHVHVWDPAVLSYGWLNSVPALNRPFLPHELPHPPGTRAVFVEADCRDDQALKEVDWVASLGATWPELAAIVAFAPISRGDSVCRDLAELRKRPLVRGVRQLFQDRESGFMVAPETLAGARQAGRAGFTFDACVRSSQLSELAAFAARVPELDIVLDHMGKPPLAAGGFSEWSTAMRELARQPNVVVKISGAGAEADPTRPLAPQALPFIRETLNLFGAERCMTGSDWPVSLTEPDQYQDWILTVEQAMAGASAGERESVAHGTAVRVYRLEADPGPANPEEEKD
ncbi:amidohydrolase family protein [Pseudarthrobacter sp. BRE9]|uniref:amidohydrolase family protein n=1 Tax=Pseudarthrobacter sp. BRE9 TaxID=2962582 RepID=UPI002881D236|nr:amidohydrolase family protein [Pseudarthrobacter sp. BRE9]MDT0170477.1 amidohydrolase family protein [Pseudarthrobacter sp. BRE9]